MNKLKGLLPKPSRSNLLRPSLPAGTLLLSLYAIAPPVPAFAQAGTKEEAPSKFMCLQGREGFGEHTGRPFYIAVPGNKMAGMVERGFELTACGKIERTDKSEFCKLADQNDAQINTYFWMRFSYTPRERCDFIESASPQ